MRAFRLHMSCCSGHEDVLSEYVSMEAGGRVQSTAFHLVAVYANVYVYCTGLDAAMQALFARTSTLFFAGIDGLDPSLSSASASGTGPAARAAASQVPSRGVSVTSNTQRVVSLLYQCAGQALDCVALSDAGAHALNTLRVNSTLTVVRF